MNLEETMEDNSTKIDVRNLPDWFWETFTHAEGDHDKMRAILEQLTDEQLCQFYTFYERAIWKLCQEPYTNYMGSGSPSEDAQWMYASTAVSQGKEYYLRVLDHPAQLAEMKDEWPDFDGLADGIYEDRHGYGIGEEEEQEEDE
jgi:hypothetical protein